MSKDDAIAFLRRKLIEVQNPEGPDSKRPYKLEFKGENKQYDEAISDLKDQLRSEENKLDLLEKQVRSEELKDNHSKL